MPEILRGELTYRTIFEDTDVIKVIDNSEPPKYVQATNPNPPDGAMDVSLNEILSWTPGRGAISHNVYFGKSNPPWFVGNQTAATFDPGTMNYITTYYWRIDEVSKQGVTTGQLWSFKTMEFPPPP